MSPFDLDAATKESFRHLQEGRTVKAEESILAIARDAETLFGAKSLEYAAAQNALGTIFANIGKPDCCIKESSRNL